MPEVCIRNTLELEVSFLFGKKISICLGFSTAANLLRKEEKKNVLL